MRNRGASPPAADVASGGERIIHKLHAMVRLPNDAFVAALYQQVLHRPPSQAELNARLQQLSARTAKTTIISELIGSAEAEANYNRMPPEPMQPHARTIANVMQQILFGADLLYIYALYSELYGRVPDTSGLTSTHALLRGGMPRLRLFAELLSSSEGQSLLAADAPPVDRSVWRGSAVRETRSAASAVRVGIFLMFPEGVSLDGEGIGRFTTHLADGLLSRFPNLYVHVAMTSDSAHNAGIFGAPYERFPGRVHFHTTDSVETANRDIGVDVWIVPYIGLPLALGLRKPIVVCLHDLVHWHFPLIYYEAETMRCHMMDRYIRDLAHRASAVIFSSEFIRRHEGLRMLGLPPERTHVIRPAAPDAGAGIADERAFRDKYRLYEAYVTFPTVLRLHKNGDRLIEAYTHYRSTPEGQADGLQLVFTDSLEHARQTESIRSALDRCPESIRSGIRFLGRIPGADLPSLYRYATGTIVPTLFEGSCPFPILESLNVGTPVAAGRIGVVEEVATNPELLLPFDPYQVSDISQAIGRLRRTDKGWALAQRSSVGGVLNRTWGDVAAEYGNLILQLA